MWQRRRRQLVAARGVREQDAAGQLDRRSMEDDADVLKSLDRVEVRSLGAVQPKGVEL